MCGLCGELRFDGRPADLGAIQQMTARLERRGLIMAEVTVMVRSASVIGVWR